MILHMRLPRAVVIPADKLSGYLLVARRHNDKAKFLERIGFTQDNPEVLEAAIRDLAAANEAVVDRQDVYGIFYRVEGSLVGPKGRIEVVTIWLERTVDGEIRFITLKPRR
jgi:hypothetical protein